MKIEGIDKKFFVLAAALFVVNFSWLFFLAASGITLENLMKFSLLFDNIGKIISLNFILFLIVFPLSYAIIIIAARKMPRITAHILGLMPAAVAVAIAFFIFPLLQSYWIVWPFYLIGIPLLIETAFINFNELKHFVTARTLLRATGRGLLLVTLGLLILALLVSLSAQQKFEDDFIVGMSNIMGGNINLEGFGGITTDVAFNLQKQLADSLAKTPQFQKLLGKSDADVQEFVAMIEAQRSMTKEQYEQLYGAMIEGQTDNTTLNMKDAILIAREKIPLLDFFFDFLWLINSVIIVSMFMVLCSLVIKPLSMIYGLILSKLI